MTLKSWIVGRFQLNNEVAHTLPQEPSNQSKETYIRQKSCLRYSGVVIIVVVSSFHNKWTWWHLLRTESGKRLQSKIGLVISQSEGNVLQIRLKMVLEMLWSRKGMFYKEFQKYSVSQGVTGWLRLVGSMKLQDSFTKEPNKRDNILQKRPIILSILLTVATP